MSHHTFLTALGVECKSAAEGKAELLLALTDAHMNTWQVAHGGVSMTLLDSAMGFAGRSLNPESGASITVEMKTSFLRPGGRPGQIVKAIGTVIHHTRTMCFCEAELLLDGKLVAKGSGTFKFPRLRPAFPGRDAIPAQQKPAVTSGWSVSIMDWEDAREWATEIRFQVFVQEQKVPVEMELDEWDPRSRHGVVRDADGAPVATGRILPDGHIGRMAVRQGVRGQGAGKALLDALIECARAQGHSEVVLSAQLQAAPFYRQSGFNERGAPYLDAGITHIEMRRTL